MVKNVFNEVVTARSCINRPISFTVDLEPRVATKIYRVLNNLKRVRYVRTTTAVLGPARFVSPICNRIRLYQDFDNEDGDEESIVLSNERIKFYVSRDQMQRLNLSYSIKSSDADGLDFSEMVVLAASFEDCHELGPGDIIWAKLPGENH